LYNNFIACFRCVSALLKQFERIAVLSNLDVGLILYKKGLICKY